ncbi:hypothetical protein KKE92_01140 [Candidatus Micrarchaeota archaeon]|nr:hypothetical protein [Candidatus Micrarchaeota archaeon]MBU1682151.1 hypothetical protein [Candidatus Micrarchaeota archaeon]
MAKKSASPGAEAPPGIPRGLKIGNPMTSQASRTIKPTEVLARLSGLGKGFNEETQSLLSVPGLLFERSGNTSVYYSVDLDFGVADITSQILHSIPPTPSKNDYGIALYERANTTYFVLVDMRKRIIVHERLSSYQTDSSDISWEHINETIKSAIALAKKTPDGGSFVLFNGTLKVIRPRKSSPSEKPAFDPTVPKNL